MAKRKNSRELDELQVSLLDDKNFLKGIIETFCQRLLEEEITHHLQAETYQRTEERRGYRNGYKPRRLKDSSRKIRTSYSLRIKRESFRQSYLEGT